MTGSYVKDRTYSGKTQDVLLAVKELAERMSEHDLRSGEIVLPFSDGTVTIKLTR